MSTINSWANFLMNEKLEYSRVGEYWTLKLIELCETLAAIRPPNISMHKYKLESRRLVCLTAMEMGLDLTAIKNNRGKMAMGRGLLDAWNKAATEKYGSVIGTASALEAKRRDVITRLRAEGIGPPKPSNYMIKTTGEVFEDLITEPNCPHCREEECDCHQIILDQPENCSSD